MQVLPLPYVFIRERLRLSWRAALWGYEHKVIDWSGIVDLAVDRCSEGSNDSAEIELAGLTKINAYHVDEILTQLAASSEQSDDDVKQTWLYLLLAWLFEKQSEVVDPLGQVEILYASFDYPVVMESFVRYMPATDQDDSSALQANWQRYLEACASRFKT